LFLTAFSIAAFNLGLASILLPPILTAAFISRDNFCQILAWFCCFLFVAEAI
jgi:hypothetical protein